VVVGALPTTTLQRGHPPSPAVQAFATLLGSKLPLFIRVIIALGFVLLLVAFRSQGAAEVRPRATTSPSCTSSPPASTLKRSWVQDLPWPPGLPPGGHSRQSPAAQTAARLTPAASPRAIRP